MKPILQILTEVVSTAFGECGYDEKLGAVTVSDRMDLCQFQCNGSFAAAKEHKRAPFIIAGEITDVLRKSPIFSSVQTVKPGFININVSDSYLLAMINEIAGDEFLGIPQAETPETIILDYGGPNVAKPLHIGHLRSAIIGESLKRIARAMGRRVISDVHLGDWGLQIGLVIAELANRKPSLNCFSDSFDPDTDTVPALNVKELEEIYPFASKKSKEDTAFMEEARRITGELQKGNAGYYALWKEIMRISLLDLKENYRQLNADFDLWYGESDAEKYVESLLDILNEKGLLYESDGAMVVDVSEETDKASVPPVIIKKSDNANIYATTDLATIIQRYKDFNPDKIWYVVDKRQSLHFTQVFRCAKKAGLIPEGTALEHIGFGTMNGKDGKPYKTRDGGVMRLSDFLNTIINEAFEKIGTSDFVSENERQDFARKIGIAAVKFGDLINHYAKDYIFDIDKFLSFEGKTGTYLLYTVTRINSILKKVGFDENANIRINAIYTDVERELILSVLLTGEVFSRTLSEKAPNHICDNAYKLASLFSAFYHDNHIVNEQDSSKQSAWLSLSLLIKRLLLKHLDVLGIEAVESM